MIDSRHAPQKIGPEDRRQESLRQSETERPQEIHATKEDGCGWLGGRKSAQIHQGVGPEAQAEPPEIPDDATEYGGES